MSCGAAYDSATDVTTGRRRYARCSVGYGASVTARTHLILSAPQGALALGLLLPR